MSSRITHADLQAALPDVTSTLHMPELQRPVDICRDSWGIPHIRAENEHDAFFAQGFEHSVVNMCVIPAGMMLGAKVSFAQWWMWNQIPVTLGNLVGGFLLTGLPLYYTYRSQAAIKLVEPEPIMDKVEGQEALA